MLTPAKIQELADPIEEIYIHISDELLVNIGKHLTSPTWTHTASWEIQKLSELGQLTTENAAIINKWIKSIPQEQRDAMEETRRLALEQIEREMQKAAKEGWTPPPVADATSENLVQLWEQATDKLNLVNTTMLQSSVDRFTEAVNYTAEEYAKLIEQNDATLNILNEAAASVTTGVETRNVALRRAITRISEEGLTGFYDRAGRSWTPEAYVNMDIRTTVHNTAIQAVKDRMSDWNTEVFQVSSHAGARPLCYPYQGKFYSWNNTAGEVELGNGSMVHYEPLNTTSYGEPAGLFGINCGHFPIPIVPGVTIPHGADNIQPKEANDKAYQESQQQRALEREIRAAKREVEMAGDLASPEMKKRVRDAQAQMREFIERTGRTRRYDREQIGGTPKTRQSGENVASQATIKAPEPVKLKFEDSDISEDADSKGIFYNEVKPQETQRTEDEIISMLAGGDKTGGSCASVGLAYCGQKNGIEVLDFRGTDSQKFFSRSYNLERLKDLPGIAWKETHGSYYQTTGNQLLKQVEQGKEYWFACGRHAAIVRKNEDGELQYLELQSAFRSGWQNFGKSVRQVLATRFGASSSAYYDANSFMFDVSSVKDSAEFNKILGYLNTAAERQVKGESGTIK